MTEEIIEIPSEQKTDLKPEQKIEKVADEEDKKSVPKKFIFMVAAIVVVLLAILAYNPLHNYFFPTGAVVTVSDLFLKNLNDELPQDQGYHYNQYSFILFDGLWYTEVQYENKNFQVPLHFGARDLENVSIVGRLDDGFEKPEVYLAFNPLESDDYVGVVLGELSQNLALVIHRQPIGACDRNETPACLERPIVNCSQTDKAIVMLVQDDGPKIELKGNCVVLKGKEYDLVKAADRMILLWYGIMPIA